LYEQNSLVVKQLLHNTSVY